MQSEDNTFIDAGDTSGQERSFLQSKLNSTRSLQEISVEKLSSRFCFNYAGSTGAPPNIPMTLQPITMNGNPLALIPVSVDMNRSPYLIYPYPPLDPSSLPSPNTNLQQGIRVAGGYLSNPTPAFKAYGSGSGGGFDSIFDGTSNTLPVWYGSSLGSPSVRSIDLVWGFNHTSDNPVGQNWANIVWGIRVIRPSGANVPVQICTQLNSETTMQLPSGTGDVFGDATLIIQVLHKVANSLTVPIVPFAERPNEYNIIRLTANILGACTPQPIGYPSIPTGVPTFPYAFSIGHTPSLFCNLALY